MYFFGGPDSVAGGVQQFSEFGYLCCMKQILISLILCVVFIQTNAQQIALTFDDAPFGNGPVFHGNDRTEKIINTLKEHGVNEAAFFVVTGFINADNVGRLRAYSDAGHILANHSHTHSHIHDLGTANYIRDIAMADSILASDFRYTKLYRYPFLQEGRTKSTRDSIRAGLASMNLTNGYVTVDNYDWYLNGALRRAIQRKAAIDFDGLREVYLEHVWNSIQFYDDIAKKTLGRSPKHVLLLHENDMTALYLDDLIKLIKQKGWRIIPASEAYKDPIAKELPDVLFNGQGRIGAIAFAKGQKPADLVQDSEDEQYLDDLLEAKGIFRETTSE